MKVLSLFSGVGGFDLGLERAGMQTVFQCEWDKHATKILQRHWPDVPRWGDITTLTGAHILQHAPVIDVVAWGSPCQDLSVAGKRAGLQGERSGLFHHGIRIIKELRDLTNGKYPRISIWENVAGALSSSGGADFGQVLYEMDEAGACFSEWRLLDAQYFGVPQRRRRVFVVSVFDPATANRCPNPLLPVSEGVRGDTAPSTTPGETAASTATAVIRTDGRDPILIDRAAFNQGINAKFDTHISDHPVNTLSAKMGTGGNNTPMIAFSHTQGLSAQPSETAWPTLRSEGGGHAVAFGIQGNAIGRQDHNGPQGKGHTEEDGPMFTLNTTDRHAVAFQPGTMIRLNGGVWDELAPTLRAEAKRGDNEPHVAISYEAAGFKPGASAKAHSIGYQEGVAPSLEAGGGGNNKPAVLDTTMIVRRLTPVECERLMGWPDNWTAGQADTHRYKQCGNGVASPVAQWIGQQLINL